MMAKTHPFVPGNGLKTGEHVAYFLAYALEDFDMAYLDKAIEIAMDAEGFEAAIAKASSGTFDLRKLLQSDFERKVVAIMRIMDAFDIRLEVRSTTETERDAA